MKRRFLPLVCFTLTILFTIMASIAPLNGVNQADVSNLFFTPITPAGFTFAIWSVIYFFWFFVSIGIATKKIHISKENKVLFSTAMVTTIFWLISWHFVHIGLSLILMLFLFCLLAYITLDSKKEESSLAFRGMIELTTGWIFVALILNFFVFLVFHKWISGEYAAYLGLSFLILGGFIHLYTMYKYSIFIPAFVYIWALYGIYSGQLHPSIKIFAIFIAIVILVYYIALRVPVYKRFFKKIVS